MNEGVERVGQAAGFRIKFLAQVNIPILIRVAVYLFLFVYTKIRLTVTDTHLVQIYLLK